MCPPARSAGSPPGDRRHPPAPEPSAHTSPIADAPPLPPAPHRMKLTGGVRTKPKTETTIPCRAPRFPPRLLSVEAIAPAVTDIILQQHVLQHGNTTSPRWQRQRPAINPAGLAQPQIVGESLTPDRHSDLRRLPQPRPVAGRDLDRQPATLFHLFRF